MANIVLASGRPMDEAVELKMETELKLIISFKVKSQW